MTDKAFTVFVVEDNEWYNKLLVHNISLNPDYAVETFFNGKDVLKAMSSQPDVVTVDYRLPDMDGGKLLNKIREASPETEVIIISEQEDIGTAVELLKAGAYDYLVKSEDIRDRLLNALDHIRKNSGLKEQIHTLQKEVRKKYNFQNTIIGRSVSLKKVSDMIEKAAETNITVSISGETGTGKEVTAKAIHYNSSRKDKPFIAVNMAAIPSELLESELFGHEKGAFTGAIARRKGKFEEADGGTLFLDEIGEMQLNFQAKLLRALQEKEITRVGSNEAVKTNCRIIVATSRNLQEEVEKKNFRDDLYYRLLGLPIHLPPLRERGNDILLLSKYFMEVFCKENQMPEKEIDEAAKEKLLSHTWPGNIRELKSVIELAVVMSGEGKITGTDITLRSAGSQTSVIMEGLSLREYNRRLVNHYMERFNQNTRLVAEKLDIGQTTVYRLLKEDKNQPNGQPEENDV